MQATMLRGQLCNKVSQLLVLFFQLHKPRMHSSHIQLQQFVRQGSQFRVFLLVWHDGESRIGNAVYFLVGVIRYHWCLLKGVSLDCWCPSKSNCEDQIKIEIKRSDQDDQIKWRGLGRHRHGPDVGAMGYHDWGYVGADEWTGCCPVADRGMFIEAAKKFQWRNKTYPHDSMVYVLDGCPPTLISPRSYKVTDSVHAHLSIKLPPATMTLNDAIMQATPLNRPAMCVNVIRVVDVRPSEEITKRDLLNSMDIISSFDLKISAVSMTVDEGLDMQFVHLENTLRNLGKKSMRITPQFLFGVVPHTTFESPPRSDRRRFEPEFRRIYGDIPLRRQPTAMVEI
jgi:hypothetical protein